MAEHFYPHQDGKAFGNDLFHYINTPELLPYAREAVKLLSSFHNLTVWKVQCKHPKRMKNNCWYVGFIDRNEPFLMNFTITPSNLNIEFRFSQYIPEKRFEELKWQTNSWRCADIKSYGDIKNIIHEYLNNISDDFYSDKLKSSGASFVEKILYRDLKQILPNIFIEQNKRPDDLRSDKDKPLELDLYLPEIGIAIEVQGPQHFMSLYGDNSRLKLNDQVKIQWCKDKGIKLIWVSWEGYNKHMLRMEKSKRLIELKNKIDHVVSNDDYFNFWFEL